MTVINRTVEPGEGIAALLEQLRTEHGEFSEIRIGETVIGIHQDKMRPCGPKEGAGCDFCCIALGVAALKKYPRQTCRHLDRHKCSIYADRPQPCRTFNCAWKKGNWPEEWRPDKIGCVVEFYENPEEGHLYAVMNVDSNTADRTAIATMFAQLCADFPEVKQIVDDKRILVVKAGAGVHRGHMLKRERGQYEEARYVLDEELAGC